MDGAQGQPQPVTEAVGGHTPPSHAPGEPGACATPPEAACGTENRRPLRQLAHKQPAFGCFRSLSRFPGSMQTLPGVTLQINCQLWDLPQRVRFWKPNLRRPGWSDRVTCHLAAGLQVVAPRVGVLFPSAQGFCCKEGEEVTSWLRFAPATSLTPRSGTSRSGPEFPHVHHEPSNTRHCGHHPRHRVRGGREQPLLWDSRTRRAD